MNAHEIEQKLFSYQQLRRVSEPHSKQSVGGVGAVGGDRMWASDTSFGAPA